MTKLLLLVLSHFMVAVLGFAAGIYALPILIAPDAPSSASIDQAAAQAEFTGEFNRELAGSDRLHWGEGIVAVGSKTISLKGEIAPGPDYRLYLSPEFVETEEEFNRLKAQMALVGEVKTFHNFIVPVPGNISPEGFTTVIVWCETFGQFITSAKYR